MSQTEIATFAAGCFWGVESTFRALDGVVETAVGYTGGHTSDPTYKDVCGGRTGHAEAVQVEFDPRKISYEDLLRVFWNSHDPTSLNRQGLDVGSQYRSAIFTHNQQQFSLATASKAAIRKPGVLSHRIVTEIIEAPTFYRAEEYHQRYHEKNGGGCR